MYMSKGDVSFWTKCPKGTNLKNERKIKNVSICKRDTGNENDRIYSY